MIVRRVAPMSVAKLYGLGCAAAGLIFGLMFAALGMLTSGLNSANIPGLGAFGAASIVVLPIIYGVFGFVAGLIGGALYNLFAGMVGGIEIETS